MESQPKDPTEAEEAGQQLDPDEVFNVVLGLLEAQGSRALAPALREAHRLRGGRLFRLMTLVIILPAFDEAFTHCDALDAHFQNRQKLQDLAWLIRRVKNDIVIATEGLLMGRQALVADCMRDVMEIEMLFRDFGARPENIGRWVSADEKTVLGTFSPGRVRRRIAEDVYPGQDVDLPEAWEYQIHSQGLHPDPRDHPHSEKAVETWEGEGKLLFEAGEILGHARRFFKATDFVMHFVDEGGGDSPASHTELAMLQQAHDAWMEHVAKMQEESGVNLPAREPRPRKGKSSPRE